ncbi:hypothetical protein D477_004436 [Arthrobacter crystallopoietes BAB-32]|uniref:Uncharacterized protein n=1 Tax=Arthrobacter crystallopoietes BAB-32 TaxID=1246476 RepID=N1V5W7_9MICC|nr:hypothetical protein D477_004436 [Arthrobacter crystallopoietes BAB-32]
MRLSELFRDTDATGKQCAYPNRGSLQALRFPLAKNANGNRFLQAGDDLLPEPLGVGPKNAYRCDLAVAVVPCRCP